MTVTSDTVTMREAAQILGISNATIWRLARDGVLPTYQNPLDRREKLIRRDDLQRLRAQGRPTRHFVSDGSDTDPVDVPASRIKEWIHKNWHDGSI